MNEEATKMYLKEVFGDSVFNLRGAKQLYPNNDRFQKLCDDLIKEKKTEQLLTGERVEEE